MGGPLEGVRVVDMSAVVSGPWAGQILADQGADVIKVEPLEGDITRNGSFRVADISAMFMACNRGKRSVAVNLAEDAGIDAVKRLVATADVFIQNFRPGACERMGIGYDALTEVNADLVYVSISGFGPSGPYSQWRVYDPIIQAISGVVSTQRSLDIPIPDLVRTIIADKSTALTVAQSISAALFARATGKAGGQHLEIAMLDSLLYFLWPDNFNGETFTGEVTPGVLLHDVYRIQATADGQLVYFAVSDSEWEGLCTALGHPEWWQEPRFHDIAQRIANFEALGALLDATFREFPTDDLLQRLHDNDVPAAPVNTLTDVFTDPQVVHNESIHNWEHPVMGPTRTARPPVKFSETPVDPRWAADQLGQSTRQVLAELGYGDDEIASLADDGVIV